jgi:predicted peptidase
VVAQDRAPSRIPQNGRGWWDNRDIAGVIWQAMLAYHVDPKRVYVTGLSMGGGATWTLASAVEEGSNPSTYWATRFAAIAPISGAADSRFSHSGICQGIAAAKLPVWAFHGDHDTVVSAAWSSGWVDKLNLASNADGYACATAASPAAKLTLYPGVGHDAWTQTYDPANEVEPGRNLYQWLLAHRRP